MVGLLYSAFFLGIPVGATIFFIISLCRYLLLKNQLRQATECADSEELKRRKVLLIVSAVIFAVVLAVAVTFVALLILAVAYM